ncbi:MAG: hypothetical protein JO250_05915 [Armatimonadetes bacterium]|nr:hypothetical protein [Armatimonadota bacterium]
MSGEVSVFERPLPAGWVYPCSTADIAQRLSLLPARDLEGLWAVGLVPATRKDCWANGRYFPGERPTIHLYSFRDTLSYRQPPHTRRADVERGLAVELAYGMHVEQTGGRFLCRWDADSLRRFILGHVLLHEVGHHVYQRQRQQQDPPLLLRTRASEQFAEDYALRLLSAPKFR